MHLHSSAGTRRGLTWLWCHRSPPPSPAWPAPAVTLWAQENGTVTHLGPASARAGPKRPRWSRAAPYLLAMADGEQDGPSRQEQDAEAEKKAAVAHGSESDTAALGAVV